MPAATRDWALRARPHESALRKYLESLEVSHSAVSLTTLGTPVMVLLASAASVYLSYVLLAVVTQRHLFGDGAWFLVKMLSENRVAIWNVAGWHDIFVGRFGAFAYQEYPTLLASRLGIHDLRELSVVYGLTLFAFKPLSILLCYHFARDKRYVIFPIVTLFAVTINSEGYIVSETHLMSALFWPALFGLLYCRQFKRWDLLAMVVVSAPLLLCYETMAFYGLILLGATIYRFITIAKSPEERWLTVAFGLWYALGAIFGVLAIIFPRDLSNRGDFLKSLLFVFANDHIGARVSLVVLLLCALVLAIPSGWKRTPNFLVGVSVLSSMAIPAYIIRHPGRTSLDSHIVARTMNAVVPFGLALIFIAVHFSFIRVSACKFKRLFLMAAVLGTCQSCWHVIATAQWAQMTTLLRWELRTHSGPVAFQGSALSEWVVDGYPVRNLHADWPLMPMSIIFADHAQVRTLLLPPIGGYEPFNPFSERTLPDLHRYGVDYRPYLASLADRVTSYELGSWISLNAKTDAAGARQVGEWWEAESWGTWTGKDAAIEIKLDPNLKSDLALEAVAGAFVNEKNPEIDVQVTVNDIDVGNWSFRYSKNSQPFETRQLAVPTDVLRRSSPTVIRFQVAGARSPDQLGVGRDPRILGLALVRMRLSPIK